MLFPRFKAQTTGDWEPQRAAEGVLEASDTCGVTKNIIGGLFATSAGYGAPVYAEPQSPSFIGSQKWRLQKVEGKNTFNIIAVGHPPLTIPGITEPIVLPTVGWGLARGADGDPSRIITLQTELAEFVLRPYGDQSHPDGFTVIIQRPGSRFSLHLANIVGVDSKTEALEVEGHYFPSPDAPPQWQFIRHWTI
ncbi:hypothetical protein CVT24_004395 [Panaeolus cyanescens]|uniref:Uncharacterized protein n=1 Tax=Panaeolus cyanescens TaxID=181874 RepID=A0A409YBJ1_9AGAR|nr:hypothetical protein CVT24_004395 [Panaeolus cyanescens]